MTQFLGLPGQLTFLDQVRGLLLGPGQDLLGFLARALQQPFDLIGHAPGGLDDHQ